MQYFRQKSDVTVLFLSPALVTDELAHRSYMDRLRECTGQLIEVSFAFIYQVLFTVFY
jgi:hypothetical protein